MYKRKKRAHHCGRRSNPSATSFSNSFRCMFALYTGPMGIDKASFEAVLRRPAMEEDDSGEILNPGLGQLPLEEITRAQQDRVDELLTRRHGLYPQYMFKKNVENPLILKRFALARLEGISLDTLVESATVFGSDIHTMKSLKSILSRSLEPTVVQKIEENADERIRLSAIQTDHDLRSLITDICKKTGLQLEELFDIVPAYSEESRGRAGLPVRMLLEAYYLALQGGRWSDIVKKLNTHPDYADINPSSMPVNAESLSKSIRRYFSKKAREKMNLDQGRPRLEDN